jgi:hypothetical protein
MRRQERRQGGKMEQFVYAIVFIHVVGGRGRRNPPPTSVKNQKTPSKLKRPPPKWKRSLEKGSTIFFHGCDCATIKLW